MKRTVLQSSNQRLLIDYRATVQITMRDAKTLFGLYMGATRVLQHWHVRANMYRLCQRQADDYVQLSTSDTPGEDFHFCEITGFNRHEHCPRLTQRDHIQRRVHTIDSVVIMIYSARRRLT
ncbi:hypothetical protein SSYM_1838 [Serratia symbiotica str. Tucson]|uniref:Uncharacterized protein n=1 Tax=Serratia symbiotica str. Tucson TaxID=914128 RepID=E9CMT8_9GAMM|nr:hypothetical protein SSYM_1838 [Serratia symbiotica str. Tucson]